MSGTDHSQAAEWSGPQPSFVLVEPQMGENIGGAARAMYNFGLEWMRIVNPRDGWPNQKATTMASGAARVLDQVRLTGTTAEACDDLHYVFATTARTRDLTKPVMTPERAMAHARSMIADGKKVGVLFGPERAGLANDDVVRANALISVPVNPAFASLNLAQCVLLLAYEWRRQGAVVAPEEMMMAGTEYATSIEVEKLSERLEERLRERRFFWPEDKAESMRLNLRNLFSRLPLTGADVRTLHGVFRSLAEKRNMPKD
jgi:tRNA/rRNA methyltransferase